MSGENVAEVEATYRFVYIENNGKTSGGTSACIREKESTNGDRAHNIGHETKER
jgi:hypothetical protein